ncbi:hypothetical protein K440DRAFT_661671 [Wilcoxina mikolae CBS 423.85]|nr:hypothetical protein K440DRAFT_661671 [Wilcoxina mikolae CBS 423.85]
MALVRLANRRWSSADAPVQLNGPGKALQDRDSIRCPDTSITGTTPNTISRRRDRLKAPLKSIFRSSSRTKESTDTYLNQGSTTETSLPAYGRIEDRSDSLWKRAVDSLPPDVIAALGIDELDQSDKVEILDRVLLSAEYARNTCLEKRWKFTWKGEAIVLHDTAEKILAWLDKFRQIGDIIIQYDPVHAALPWAGVRFLLDVVLSDTQNTGAVLIGIEKITHLMPRCAIYENLYIRVNPQPHNVKAIERALIELYASILVFLVWSRRHFDQNLAFRTVRGIFATETAQSLLDSIDTHDGTVRKEANLADAEYQRFASLNLVQVVTDHGFQLRDILGELEKPILRIELAVTVMYEDLQESKRNTILQWLSSAPYPQHHENVQEGILENTGEWLLQHETFRRWQTSSASTILWLHGIPGAGKTKLTSVVLDSLLNPPTIVSQNNGEAVAYFYCNRNELQRQNPEVILRTIIQQLSSYGNSGLPKCVISKYKERNKNGVALGPPLFHDSLNLLIEILDIHSSTVIVIDALDEIDSKFRRQEFLQALKYIISASQNLVKLFVASRDDTDISLALDNVPNLYINAEDNKDDIERFIKHEVARSISQGKLLQVSKNLGRLPETLEGAYSQIYNTIKNGRSPEVARIGLMWLVCATKLLTPEEWSAAVSRSASIMLNETITVDADSLLKICHNLVVWDRQQAVLRFSHSGSVQEYLERNHFTSADAHRMAAECCLTLLCEPSPWGVEDPMDASTWHPFAIYCITFWGSHVQQCDDESNMDLPVLSLLNRFMGTSLNPSRAYHKWLELAMQKLHHSKGSPLPFLSWVFDRVSSRPSNPLMAAAYFGFSGESLIFWNPGTFDVDAQNSRGESLLFLAASCRKKTDAIKVVNILLRNGVKLNSPIYSDSRRNPLMAAIRSQNVELVDTLFQHRVELANYRNILEAAAGEGSKHIITHILSTHPNLEITEDVLIAAARNPYDSEVMELLLMHNSDAEITEAMLMLAAYNTNGYELIKLLIERMSFIKVSENILVEAARNYTKAVEVLKLLLAHDPQARITESVLMEAATNPNGCDLMQMLLERNPTVEITENVLIAAATNTVLRERVLKLLLAHNPQAVITENLLRTAAQRISNRVMGLLLTHNPNVLVTEVVVLSAAENPRGYRVMRLLLERSDIYATTEILETAKRCWLDGDDAGLVVRLLGKRIRDPAPNVSLPPLPLPPPLESLLESFTLGPSLLESPAPALADSPTLVATILPKIDHPPPDL